MTQIETTRTIADLENDEDGALLGQINTVAGEYIIFQNGMSYDYVVYSRWDGVPPACYYLRQEGEGHQTYVEALQAVVVLVARDDEENSN